MRTSQTIQTTIPGIIYSHTSVCRLQQGTPWEIGSVHGTVTIPSIGLGISRLTKAVENLMIDPHYVRVTYPV